MPRRILIPSLMLAGSRLRAEIAARPERPISPLSASRAEQAHPAAAARSASTLAVSAPRRRVFVRKLYPSSPVAERCRSESIRFALSNRAVYHPRRLKILDTDLPEVKIVEPAVFGDTRGWFMETYSEHVFREAGLPTSFAQDNHSYSKGGVVRGLHYQLREPQGKLVRCSRGAILDVAVDIRRSSPNFGRWTAVELTAENRRMLWVPPRFAHGFAVLAEEAEVLYKCTTMWDRETDRSLLWNDPEIGIRWPLTGPEVSTRDAAGKPLRDAELFES